SEEMKEESISDIIEQTLNIVWNEIKYKAQIKKDFGKIPKVICNAQKISQVIINLLINASQAIEEQGLIGIKTYFKDGSVCVEISDNGEGIEEKDLKNIFDPFFTTKPVGKGTGLGLNVVYDIVKMHEGEILVDSKRGSGTTFTVSIPLNKK
ncbi:MAG: GHKL domain-containing protein, partial [Candidatus Omnitrophica bacterium]|nr:GHKL domain-containing protein [Candidatus Omnitrophota bacterium]